jgi:hypothetical protein
LLASRKGSSIEARIYCEDPAKGFQPAPGKLSEVIFPGVELARVETWVESGTEVSPYYDPMIAKIIVTGADRTDAVVKMQSLALEACSFSGTETNLRLSAAVAASETFVSGLMTTAFLSPFNVPGSAFEVLEGGTQTTVQDYPGRLGSGMWVCRLRADGLAGAAAGESAGGQWQRCARAGDDGDGREAALRCDCCGRDCGADMDARLDGSSGAAVAELSKLRLADAAISAR